MLITFLAILLAFCLVLGDLQVVRGAEFLAQSSRKIANEEVVPAARGDILDRFGRVLVSNRITYQVTLDAALMKDAVHDTILALLEICREEGVVWNDTLPVTASAPYLYTLEDANTTARSRFSALLEKLEWAQPEAEARLDQLSAAQASRETEGDGGVDPVPDAAASPPQPLPADGLLDLMRDYFALDPSLSPRDARALCGVLYELELRDRELTWAVYLFASQVDIDLISKVKETSLPGVKIALASVRAYHTQAAAHLLGRVAQIDAADWPTYRDLGYDMDATVGNGGVEEAFESYLRGTEGTRTVEYNTGGKAVSETYLTLPRPGNTVTLTLDIRLQEAVERTLADRVPALSVGSAEGAAAVVVDVNSGDILASASYPTYDPATYSTHFNEIAQIAYNPFFNRALSGQYAPGSTYKMVAAVAALEEGLITPETIIRDTGRYTYYSDYQPMCWIYRSGRGTHGNQTVSQAITNSCNIFFYDVGRRLGIRTLERYARSFGLGEPTGVELPERIGVVAGPDYTQSLGQVWNEGSTLSAAIGQENNRFTPLQLANYTAALVNGGSRWSAHLLKSVKANDNTEMVLENTGTLLSTVDVSEETVESIKSGMLEVTQSGSVARYFRDLPVTAGAKTGSAQVSADSESNAVFVCFAPYDHPEIALAIVVEKGGSGSELGAMAADILSYYFSAEAALDTTQPELSLLR